MHATNNSSSVNRIVDDDSEVTWLSAVRHGKQILYDLIDK